MGHSHGAYEQGASVGFTTCACAPLRDHFHCHSLVATDSAGHDSYCAAPMKMLQRTPAGGMCHMQHLCHCHNTSHCTAPECQEYQAHEQNAGLGDAAMTQTSEQQLERQPVEYEYYVWDAVAQEYIQTDQKTGEKMLQDPQYFQYHYRLVENTQDGEPRLLPEPLDEPRCPEEPEFVNPDVRCYCQSRRECGDDISVAPCMSDLLITPEILITPRGERSCPPSSAVHVACLHEPRNSPRCRLEDCEKENRVLPAFGVDNRSLENQGSHEDASACVGGTDKLHCRWRKKTRGKCLGPTSGGLSVALSNARYFMSCCRPWEKTPATMRDRELQLRQLRHLQRVQELEKEELLRRQRMLDEMAASLPRSSQHLVTTEVNRTGRAKTRHDSDLRISGMKASRPNVSHGLPEGDRRSRSDPVNRGRYFRAKWKSDRFLEQQRHPAFDVKAYDAWLKSSGHLLRGRALELQQEEQKLVSKMQQERNGGSRRCGY